MQLLLGGIYYLVSGDFIQTIPKSHYTDLGIYNERLYATDWTSPAIHVYDCHTWQQLNSIRTPCSDMKHFNDIHHHQLSVDKDAINFSCANFNMFYILDIQGNLKQQHGPAILLAASSSPISEGEQSNLNGPIICQEDKNGAVIVGDCNYNRVLVLSEEGKWIHVRLNEKADGPCGAVCWRGRLYVSTWGDNKLTMFQ